MKNTIDYNIARIYCLQCLIFESKNLDMKRKGKMCSILTAKRQSIETLNPDVVFNKLQSNNHKYVQRIKGKSMKKWIGNLNR